VCSVDVIKPDYYHQYMYLKSDLVRTLR
jgi:hypothetical protein